MKNLSISSAVLTSGQRFSRWLTLFSKKILIRGLKKAETAVYYFPINHPGQQLSWLEHHVRIVGVVSSNLICSTTCLFSGIQPLMTESQFSFINSPTYTSDLRLFITSRRDRLREETPRRIACVSHKISEKSWIQYTSPARRQILPGIFFLRKPWIQS